jgi:ankyrin repeat protein
MALAGCMAPAEAPVADAAPDHGLPPLPEALNTPLVSAIGKGDAGQIRALLASGEYTVADIDGYALLELAASQRPCDPDVVSTLIEFGADAGRVDPTTGSTALLEAAASGSAACFDRLLGEGFDPAHVDTQAHGMVANAYLSGDREIFDRLVRGREFAQFNRQDLALALLFSLKKEDWSACSALLAVGADPRVEFQSGAERVSIATLPEMSALTNCPEPY